MTGQKPEGERRARNESAAARRARLGQELRANLLKRKAQSRARKAEETPRDEGGQSQA